MTLDGKSRAKKNVKLLFNDAITSFPNKFAPNFNYLMEKIVYPTYAKKFSKKFDLLLKKNPNTAKSVLRINGDNECAAYGSDCHVAMDRISDTILKMYRVFSIMNKDFSELINSSTSSKGKRKMGTFLANLQFQLNDDQGEIASYQLEQDLTKLIRNIIPGSELSLTDMVGFLGYSNVLGEMSKRSFKTVEDNCDLNDYMLRWDSYFSFMFQSLNNKSSTSDAGNVVE